MTINKKPKPDTAAHRAIVQLVNLGGRATVAQLMSCIRNEYASHSKFNSQVTVRLTNYGYADYDGQHFQVTGQGRNYVDDYHRTMCTQPKYVGKIAPPRTAAAFRPLQLNQGAAPFLAGSDEYRAIPSLMGDVRRLPSGEVVE